MGMIDLFKEFHSQTVEQEYPASARLLGYWLIGEFNANFWKEELRYSVRELSRLTGLPTTSVHRAIKYLCDRGFLKTWRKNNKTIFKLVGDKVPSNQRNGNGTQAEQFPLLNIPIKGIKEDNKDIKTNIIQSARARDSINLEDNITPEDIDSLLEYWEKSGGCKLNQMLVAKLTVLARDAGLSELKVAIDKANEGANNPKYGFSLEYVKSKLVKEVTTNEGNPLERGYDNPETDAIFEGLLSTIKV